MRADFAAERFALPKDTVGHGTAELQRLVRHGSSAPLVTRLNLTT